MKNLFLIFLLFGLLASSFVSAEDRTSDPNDQDTLNVVVAETDGTWQVNLANQDSLTNEDFNIDINIQPSDQDDDVFDDFNDSDGDDNDDLPISGASFGSALKEGLEKNADGDFDLDLIRKEILRKARDEQDDVDYTNDDDSTDSTDLDSTPQPDDLMPDNGKISTQVVSTDDDKNDEIEDSDDGDDADIIDDNTDSNDDSDIDDDYQDNDSAMADDDYVNDPDAVNDDLADEVDYNDDDSDDGDDATDNFLSQDYVKTTPFDSVNLQRIKLNMTTIDISPQDSDDTDDGLDDIYYNAADDDDSSDSDYYDIYDSKYQEEPERGGSDDSNDSSYDYDIFIDVDDSAWDSYLTNDNDDDVNNGKSDLI